MKRYLIPLLLMVAASASAMERAQGWCAQGGKVSVSPPSVGTAPLSRGFQQSYKNCTVTVYVSGSGGTLATIYGDNASTPLANPFTADQFGLWYFYATSNRYDIQISGGGPPALSSPYTFGDILLFDPADLFLFNALGALCKGTSAMQDTAAFQTVASLSNATVWIHNPGVCVLSANVTIPATVALRIDNGAQIQVTGGFTLTIQGNVQGSNQPIFTTGSSVFLTGNVPVQAVWFAAGDIGAQTNAAMTAACSSGPCSVTLPVGASLTQTTTMVVPATYVDLDLGDSIITYTGTGDAITVQTSNLGYDFISGRIHDGQINGTSAGASGIHQQSRIGMDYERVRIGGFTNGSCMWWENTVGAGVGSVQFTEQNTILKNDYENCLYGLRWTVNGGTNSFAYNDVLDTHFGVNDGQIGLSMEGTGSTQSLFANGHVFTLKFNLNTASTPGRAVSLTAGADWERSTVSINGEQTSGAAASYGLYKDAASVFANLGWFTIDGTMNSAPSGGAQLLYPNGFGSAVGPFGTFTTDMTGLIRAQQDIVLGTSAAAVHINTAVANQDTSFIAVVTAGNTSVVHTFLKEFNSVPNCSMTPNTKVLGASGMGDGTWYLNPAVNQLTVSVGDIQGSNVTFFVHCLGNPN